MLYEYLLTTITLLGGEGSGGLCPWSSCTASSQVDENHHLLQDHHEDSAQGKSSAFYCFKVKIARHQKVCRERRGSIVTRGANHEVAQQQEVPASPAVWGEAGEL